MQVRTHDASLSSSSSSIEACDSVVTRNPPIFELHVGAETIFYVGEDPTWSGKRVGFVTSAESGVGLEQALCWESAIRKALMPVTPQPSTDFDKGSDSTSRRALIFIEMYKNNYN